MVPTKHISKLTAKTKSPDSDMHDTFKKNLLDTKSTTSDGLIANEIVNDGLTPFINYYPNYFYNEHATLAF